MSIIPFTKPARPYKHLGRRIVNVHTGIVGTIKQATKRTDAKRGWKITIAFDGGRDSLHWTDRDIFEVNRLVADDYRPDYGPVPNRIQALIARIDEGGMGWQRGYAMEARVGCDYLTIWKPMAHREFETMAGLYGGQGQWKALGKTQEEAWANLRAMLAAELTTTTL